MILLQQRYFKKDFINKGILMFDFEVRDVSDDSRSSILRLGQRRFRTPYCCLIHTDMKRLIHGSNLIHQQTPRINLHEIIRDFNKQKEIDRCARTTVQKRTCMRAFSFRSQTKILC